MFDDGNTPTATAPLELAEDFTERELILLGEAVGQAVTAHNGDASHGDLHPLGWRLRGPARRRRQPGVTALKIMAAPQSKKLSCPGKGREWVPKRKSPPGVGWNKYLEPVHDTDFPTTILFSPWAIQ